MALKLVEIYGSVRSQRQGIRVARFIAEQARRRGFEVTLIDPAEWRLPLLERMYKEYPRGAAPEILQKLSALLSAADGYLLVTAEYNHAAPPALVNLLDHFLEEYFWKPSAIVSYSVGSFGGTRASIALRAMTAELGMPSIPSAMAVPHVHEAFTEDGRPNDPAWLGRTDRFLSELEWYVNALRAARVRDGKETSPARTFCEAQQDVPSQQDVAAS